MARRYFTPRFFEFFEELSRNNKRDWFVPNKARYEHEVREPMLAFIADFAPRLRKISPCYVADPRPTGGSMMRIYRNLRFSRDKTPYHINASAAFGHRSVERHHGSPSFYLSLSPAEAFAGVGVWHPEPDAVARIRNTIVARAAKWKGAVNDRKFKARFELMGDMLSRPPKGFDASHPLIEHLKRRDFIGGTEFTRQEVCSAEFMDLFAGACKDASPFMKFLTEAMGLKW
ncbi:MAG: DUF2461 domain-containing protein [Candidatus Binatus sp.]